MLNLVPPPYDTAPLPGAIQRRIVKTRTTVPYGAVIPVHREDIRATAAGIENNLRAGLIRLLDDVGITHIDFVDNGTIRTNEATSVDDALDMLLESAILNTPPFLGAQTPSNIDDIVQQWGGNRAPFISELDVKQITAHQSTSTTHRVAIIDLPGEATSILGRQVPREDSAFGFKADRDQLVSSASYLAAVDPLASTWCFKAASDYNPAILELSLRTAQGGNDTGRISDSRVTTRNMISSLITQEHDRATSITVAVTKCDVIRALLASTPGPIPNSLLGRWAALISNSRDRKVFLDSASLLLRLLANRHQRQQYRNTSSDARAVLRAVEAATNIDSSARVSDALHGNAEVDRIASQILAQLADPEHFWNLVSTGDAFSISIPCVRDTVRSAQPQVAELIVPSSDSAWHQGMGEERLQLTDVLTTAVGGAIVGTVVGVRAIGALAENRLTAFVLTAAWERVDEDGAEQRFGEDESSGCLQAYRHLLASLLQGPPLRDTRLEATS
ncbi:hypothetical protein [Actinomyces glycerinitolerans]|nr:hypothetical protein [Actinomyces glycerinitolerans]